MKLTHPQVPWPTPNPLSAGRPGPTLLLWYPHRVAGTPLLRVLGLTLAKRAVLSAQQAGFERIVIAAHPADHPGIQAELADDRVHAQVELDHHPRPTHELALALGCGLPRDDLKRVAIGSQANPKADGKRHIQIGLQNRQEVSGTKPAVGRANTKPLFPQKVTGSRMVSERTTARLGQGAYHIAGIVP